MIRPWAYFASPHLALGAIWVWGPCCTMRHCNEHKLSVLQVRRPEQESNTQRYNRKVHKCKNIRQPVKTGE